MHHAVRVERVATGIRDALSSAGLTPLAAAHGIEPEGFVGRLAGEAALFVSDLVAVAALAGIAPSDLLPF